MKKTKIVLLISAILMIGTFSCKNDIYSGFTRMDNGAYMKFYTQSRDSIKPQLGDMVRFEMIQYTNDSMFLNSYQFNQPIEIQMVNSDFEGDMFSAIQNMSVGDSATLVFPLEKLYTEIFQTSMPASFEPGTAFYSDIIILEIIPLAQVEAQQKAWLESQKNLETELLAPYLNNKSNKITKTGLIVLQTKNNKGQKPKNGDIIQINFVMTTLNNDTIVDTHAEDLIYFEFGTPFLNQGFDEAVTMLRKGASGDFIVPSALAYDSLGYQNIVSPYTPLHISIDIVDVLNRSEYEDKQAALQQQNEQMIMKERAIEAKNISKYITENAIEVLPSETGLYYIETQAGKGKSVNDGDLVTLNYVIYNLKGKRIESTYESGTPLTFYQGKDEMIPGIEEALTRMKVGGSARLIIPFELGFGDIDINEDLPKYSTLVMDIELVDIQ